MKPTPIQAVRTIGTLDAAWRVILDNGRSSQSRETRREVEEFAAQAGSRLTKIQRQLSRDAFTFAPAKGLEISKRSGGIRPLVVAPVESRIVQRAIHDVLLTVPGIRQTAQNPFSFGSVRKRKESDLGGVPAAIEAVMRAIRGGAFYLIRSDIRSFFTRIPKPTVTKIIEDRVADDGFVSLFREAIAVELENMASLRYRGLFPIHEIGVAQGNSLSPLLGNLLLSDFDEEMNANGCWCYRYVDDFLILARDRQSAERQFLKAKSLLARHGMEVNEKTCRSDTQRGFTFLGIELINGAVRPSRESRRRLLRNISEILYGGKIALCELRKRGRIDPKNSVLQVLGEVRGTLLGWGRHYSFCNEKNVVAQMDQAVGQKLADYLGLYSNVRNSLPEASRRCVLGIPLLEDLISRPIVWEGRSPVGTSQPEGALADSVTGIGNGVASNGRNASQKPYDHNIVGFDD